MNQQMNTTIALLKRETWEHRSFWMVPLVMTGIILVLFLWAMVYGVPQAGGYSVWVENMEFAGTEELGQLGKLLIPGLALPFFIMVEVVTLFYLLDSLSAERRDRSILFWKSLPVTDTATVLSKWAAIVLVFPAIVFAVVVALSLVLGLLTGIFVMFGGGNPWTLVWQHMNPFAGLGATMVFFYVETLWYLPVMGWLLLASAWARKGPFLWAVLPPLGLIVLEQMFFDTDYLLDTVIDRLALFTGHSGIVQMFEREVDVFDGQLQISGGAGFELGMFAELFATPQFWTGLGFAVLCTVAAIWLRRYRDES